MDQKKWTQSKTILIGIGITAVGGALTALTAHFQANPIPDPWNGILIGVIGAGVVYLRSVTNTGVTK